MDNTNNNSTLMENNNNINNTSFLHNLTQSILQSNKSFLKKVPS